MYRKGIGFPLITYDMTLWICNSIFFTNFYILNLKKFSEVNRLLKRFEESGDMELLEYFQIARKQYKIPMKYFGTSKKVWASIIEQKEKRKSFVSL